MALKSCTPPDEKSPEQQMFAHMIRGFETAGMPYCLLAGYDGFPEYIPSDIDFMVAPASNAKLPHLISAIADASNARLVQHLQHETTAGYFVLAKLEGNRICYLHPDSSSDYRRSGKRWLLAERVLENRRLHPHGFWIPSAADAFIYYLVKKIDKGELNAAHALELTKRYHEDCASCRERLYALLTDRDAGLIEAALTQKPPFQSLIWKKVEQALPEIKAAMHGCARPISWCERWKAGMDDIRRIWQRLKAPTGLRVVFLGPDGSGKSTIIAAVMRELSQGFRKAEYRHLRPGRLSRQMHTLTVTDPHAKPPRSKLGSYLKLLHFWSEYVVGNLLWLYPRYVCSTLVVFDRYFHDLLADPRRYRYAGSLTLAKWLGRRLPQPDLVFILDAPAEVLQSRKQEVSPDESARQRVAYQALANAFDHAHIINTHQPVEQVINDVLQHLLDFMEARTHARLKLTPTKRG